MPEQKSAGPRVRISGDNMRAYLTLPVPDDDGKYTIKDLLEVLRLRGVVMGIDQEMLVRVIEEPIYLREVEVARGRKPVAGKDGYFQYNFRREFSMKPKENADGSVDYWSINTIETVVEGQVIAIYNPAVQGENGFNVKGRAIAAKRAKEQQPIRGTGFSRSEDNLTYTASMDGKIDMKQNRITIKPIYEVYGNVDLKTGNIDFRGDVVVHGNVSSEATVHATGSIVVDGTTEGAEIEAGADIIFRGGVLGSGKAKIYTKGSIYAQFLEYATVQADENIQADVFLDCNIVAGGKVYVTGTRGYIVGGNVQAVQGIEAEQIGNNAEIRTEVRVGLKPDILERITILKKQIKGLQDNLEHIDRELKKFDRLEVERAVSYKNDPRRIKLLRSKIQCTSDLSVTNRSIEELEQQVKDSQGAEIKVSRVLRPGTIVFIDSLRVNINNEHQNVIVKKFEDKIVLRRNYDYDEEL